MARYRVTGSRPYRKYAAGEIIIGDLDPESAKRAMAMGVIELLDDAPLRLDPAAVSRPVLANESPELDPDEEPSSPEHDQPEIEEAS